ncbi:type III-A CRISPR-associated protein Csm2 [Fontivita pretiosa]|uniref:type III-A CRISPR-associated protein Csm2 n=1 Tax=Fontivita pretiosa TaxID=2989684 RepID=UPI003D166530
MTYNQRQPTGGGGVRPRAQESQLTHTAMTQYYDPQGHLRREVFIDWPQYLARILNVSRSNLRRTFDHVAALRFRIQMGESADSVLKPGIPQLHRFAQYQWGRKVIGDETRNFIQCHCNAVGYDKAKFEGFYQLFQSVMAYLPR